MIKQNELELANTDCKIESNRADNFFVCYCFCHPSIARIFGINWPISMGSVVKDSFANDVHNQSENANWILLFHILCAKNSHCITGKCQQPNAAQYKFYTLAC